MDKDTILNFMMLNCDAFSLCRFCMVLLGMLFCLLARSSAESSSSFGPWLLLNATQLASLSLKDMSYTPISYDGGNIYTGSFSSGSFSTLDASHLPRTVADLYVQTALYLPDNNNASGLWSSGGAGMVVSLNMDGSSKDAPSSQVLSDLALELGIPILSTWYNASIPQAFGYEGINLLNAASMQAMPYRHPCNLTDVQELKWGNFNLMLAKKQIMSITILQRLLAQLRPELPSIQSIALSGSSKQGASAWGAALSDSRVRVAAAMHDQAQNLTAYLDGIETNWGCLFACQHGGGGGGTGQNGTAAMILRKWFRTTPAGAAALRVLSPSEYYLTEHINSSSLVSSPVDFWLLAGDVGGCEMHDGHHFPLGIESLFLDAMNNTFGTGSSCMQTSSTASTASTFPSTTTFRYHRCSNCPECSQCKGSLWNEKRIGLLWVLGQRLLEGISFEDTMPKVVCAVAVPQQQQQPVNIVPTTTSFVVHATVRGGEGNAEGVAVTLWFSPSASRIYNNPGRAPWKSVKMTTMDVVGVYGDENTPPTRWKSPNVNIPAGEEMAWYVDARVTVPLVHFHKKSVNISDSSPIRVELERPSKSCFIPPVKFCPLNTN